MAGIPIDCYRLLRGFFPIDLGQCPVAPDEITSARLVGGHSLATGQLQGANVRAGGRMIRWLEEWSENGVGSKSKMRWLVREPMKTGEGN